MNSLQVRNVSGWPKVRRNRTIAAMLEVKQLRKSYGDLVAVDDVSLIVKPGELLGLLGPNGAGKTTTVSMIAGLIRPDRGDVLIGGVRLAGDTDPVKRRIGLVPQDPMSNLNPVWKIGYQVAEALRAYAAAGAAEALIDWPAPFDDETLVALSRLA